jgi:hypothetical protein
MSRWVLECGKCLSRFTHSTIEDAGLVGYFLPPKPQFPEGGTELECPKCGYRGTYQRTDLKYAA